MDSILVRFVIGFTLNLAVGAYAFMQQMIDDTAFLGGVALFTLIYVFMDWRAYLIIIAFFGISHFAIKRETQYRISRGEFALARAKRPLKRVLGRSLPSAIFAALFFFTNNEYFKIAFVAGYAEAICDTVSTKLGQIFSHAARSVINFQKVKHGTAGAVSWQGTWAGAAAALILGVIAIPTRFINFAELGIIVAAALTGCLIDSLISAHSHLRQRIPNEFINFFSGMAAGLISIFIIWFFNAAFGVSL